MSRRLLASYIALTVVVLVGLEVPLAIVNAHNERQDLTAKIERDAFAVASISEDVLQASARSPALQALAVRYQRDTGGRVVIVDRLGRSVADSQPATPAERSFATRPEIASALNGTAASGIRTSRTLRTRLLYVAVPVASGGVVHGAVRITYPTATLDARVRRYRIALLAVAGIVLGTAVVVGLALSRSITRPLRRLGEAATSVAEGDLSARAPQEEGPPEVRRLARQINESTDRMGALLSSQEQFVADASHELRTPLTALRLQLENGDASAALVEVERLSRVVDELLLLARADAETEPASDLELARLVRERVAVWSPFAEERGVQLRLTVGEVAVHAGERRVEQVLDNLLANALDASPRGARIDLVVREGELHVLDEGPGLTVEERRRAFDRFWRTSTKPGSGLGLAIAKRLVELDGGTITLESAPSGGIDAVVRYTAAKAAGQPTLALSR